MKAEFTVIYETSVAKFEREVTEHLNSGYEIVNTFLNIDVESGVDNYVAYMIFVKR